MIGKIKIDLPDGLTADDLNRVLQEVTEGMQNNIAYPDDVIFTSVQGYQLALNHPIELVEAEKMANSWVLKFRKKD